MGRIASGRRGRPLPACSTTPRSIAAHAHVLLLAALMGAYLVWVGGWPIFLLGVASILSGWAYTGGPLPIAYTPLGELFVVVFFGLGSRMRHILALRREDRPDRGRTLVLHWGSSLRAVLLVNNHRDVEADTRVGRRTLAIMAGPTVTNWIYAAMMLVALWTAPSARLTRSPAAMCGRRSSHCRWQAC